MRNLVWTLLIVLCAFLPRTATAVCWDAIWSQNTPSTFGKVDFIDEDRGWAVASGGFFSGSIYHTVDGGAHWTLQTTVAYALRNIDFIDADHGWAVGYYSTYRTTNGGATWTRTGVAHADLLGVSFVEENTGWAVGDDLLGGNSPIFKTTDGGASWFDQGSGTILGLNEVFFMGAQTGIAVGMSGTILRTTNGGSNWTAVPSGTTYTLNGVSLLSESFGTAVGAHGTILVTFDGGGSWTPAASGTTASLYDVAFSVGNMNGWAVGDSALVLHTPNAGFNWNREHSHTEMYPLLLGVSAWVTHAWAVGYDASGLDLVMSNVCGAPDDVVIQYHPGLPPYGLESVRLTWNPVTTPGGVTYNIYQDSLANGAFETLAGSTTDTTFGIIRPPTHRYYLVKTQTP